MKDAARAASTESDTHVAEAERLRLEEEEAMMIAKCELPASIPLYYSECFERSPGISVAYGILYGR